MGYVTQEITVGDRTEINVSLLDDTQALEEIVVVGYGTQKRVNLSGAVSTISSKTLGNGTSGFVHNADDQNRHFDEPKDYYRLIPLQQTVLNPKLDQPYGWCYYARLFL
jgi:hypothetical protein